MGEKKERKKVPRLVGMGAVGVVKEGVICITMSTAVLGSSGISMAKEMNIQNNQRVASRSYIYINDETEKKV